MLAWQPASKYHPDSLTPASLSSEPKMTVRRALVFLPLAILAACGTPQEYCIRNATREVRTLDRLIAESEANLARGYAFEESRIVRHVWVVCEPRHVGTAPQMCFEPIEDTVRRPVAIDPAVEGRKHDNLRAKRAMLLQRAESAVAACCAAYPEDPPAPVKPPAP